MVEQPLVPVEEGSERPSVKTDRFRVIRRLGTGGAADVFLAVARGLGGFQKLVVLKKPRVGVGDASVPRNLFFHEARIAARLNHPNCAQVIGIEEIDGVPVIVFEYLEGLTLAALRSEAGLRVPLEVEVAILQHTLLGLQHAHELRDYDGEPLGVVHRDVSPQNILVTYDGEVKVLDFGIAKANRQAEQTEVGVIKGKLRYMAPEQVSGLPADARTDVFAAGILLWEALTQQRLWAGLSDAKLLQQAMVGTVPPPRSLAPDAPELLEKICLRATAPNAEDRFDSAQEMATELAHAARELSLHVGREELASYLDAHFRDARSAVRAQVESELADVMHQQGEEASSAPWKTGSRVSIAPELGQPMLPGDSIGGSTVPVGGVATHAGPAEEEAAPAAMPNEAGSSGLLIGALLGFLACAVALLAWNRFAPEPALPVGPTPALATKPPDTGALTRTAEALPKDAPRNTPNAANVTSTEASVATSVSTLLSPPPMAKPPRASGSPRKASAEPGVAPAEAGPAPGPANAPPPNCEVPFELTPDGFKRFKPECLPR